MWEWFAVFITKTYKKSNGKSLVLKSARNHFSTMIHIDKKNSKIRWTPKRNYFSPVWMSNPIQSQHYGFKESRKTSQDIYSRNREKLATPLTIPCLPSTD